MKDSYDVLVVGGGPAGAVAAETAADAGLSVLLVEKRSTIGVPVRCAGRIGKDELSRFIEANPRFISAEINSVVFRGLEGRKHSSSEDKSSYILDRKVFDRELIWRAAEAGAEIQVHARAAEPILEEGKVCGAVIEQHGHRVSVRAKVVIAADGVESTFARRAGIDTTVPAFEMLSCAQYTINNIDVEGQTGQYFFSAADAPGGYCWVLPKGNRCAVIGVGIQSSKSDNGLHARNYLDRFVSKTYPKGKITELTVGGMPICRPLAETAADGLLIAGDAARITHPLTGCGIYHAMLTGRLAAETAVFAVRTGDVSKKALMAYDTAWRKGDIGRALLF